MKQKLKNTVVQMGLIVVAAMIVGMVYNLFLESPLKLFGQYKPDLKEEFGEDLSVYYDELDAETLNALMETEMAVLVDARTADNYREGHIPGAVSLPMTEFEATYEKVAPFLSEEKSIVIYCIGGKCTDSALLARELHKKGHRELFVYKGGIEEWQARGYPVNQGNGQ